VEKELGNFEVKTRFSLQRCLSFFRTSDRSRNHPKFQVEDSVLLKIRDLDTEESIRD
jgi:hypothetical protein